MAINEYAQVLDTENKPIPGLYATGEITGKFFYHNYAGGTGLTRGAVFGRIAGADAASYAKRLGGGATLPCNHLANLPI